MGKFYYPPASFYFKVYIADYPQEGVDAAFKEVEGLSMSLATTPLDEGGVNFMARKLPGKTSYEDLVLKRGLITMNSKLSNWCFSCFGNKSTGQIETKLITVQLLNYEDKPLMTWAIHDAYPIKWNVSGFNAQESSIVVESISFSYTYFVVNEDLETEEINFSIFDD